MKHKNVSIGFIGIGVMGKSMVRHLMQDGHTVYVYNRTKSKTQIITRRTGAIMIHPSLVHRGKDTKEKYLLARFENFNNNKATINAVE